MKSLTLNLLLAGGIVTMALAGLLLGETRLTMAQVAEALTMPGSGPQEVMFAIRLPRTVAALWSVQPWGWQGR